MDTAAGGGPRFLSRHNFRPRGAAVFAIVIVAAGCGGSDAATPERVADDVSKDFAKQRSVVVGSSVCRTVYEDHLACTVKYEEAGLAKTARVYVVCDPRPCRWRDF